MSGGLKVSVQALRTFARERGIEPRGHGQVPELTGVAPLDSAGRADVAFCRFGGARGRGYVQDTAAGALFVPDSLAESLPERDGIYLPCAYPRLELLRFLQRFWQEPEWVPDMTANPCVHPEARVAGDVRIGPFTVVGPGVAIGAGSRIGSNCHIEHAEIGAGVYIANNVTIGGEGFGYEDDPDTGEILAFPHTGRVVIGDRVDIGSSTCIDRGSIGDTFIGEECKIDNLVHIAHNVRLGRRCKVIALAIVGGSATIEDEVWIAPAAAIRDWRRVGARAVVGLGAVVTKDIPPGAVVMGNPAEPMARAIRRRYK